MRLMNTFIIILASFGLLEAKNVSSIEEKPLFHMNNQYLDLLKSMDLMFNNITLPYPWEQFQPVINVVDQDGNSFANITFKEPEYVKQWRRFMEKIHKAVSKKFPSFHHQTNTKYSVSLV